MLAATTLSANAALATVPATERQNLIAFFNTANGTEWIDNSNWCKDACPTSGSVTFNDPGTECTWFGIECDSSQSHVTAIILPRNNLSGSLPALDGLPALKQLYLVANDVSGGITSLDALPALEWLDL